MLTEPVPDVLERIGWTGGEALARLPPDAALLPHDERRRGSRSAGAAGGSPTTRATTAGIELDAQVIGQAAAALHRFFPLLADREITHAWGGPIDVAPRRLPIYRSRGALHAGWGFTGHGVGPSHLGGRILSGLALGVRDEFTTLPLVAPPVKRFPPEPARFARRLADPRARSFARTRWTTTARASARCTARSRRLPKLPRPRTCRAEPRRVPSSAPPGCWNWNTGSTQNRLPERDCGFESHPGYEVACAPVDEVAGRCWTWRVDA